MLSADMNVLLVTIDSCRFDSFVAGQGSSLRGMTAAKTLSQGTYTLPAHMSIFAGYLPSSLDENVPFINPRTRQLWRLSTARPKPRAKTGIVVDGTTVVEGYRNRGFTTYGVGGVAWFRSRLLQDHFDEFEYLGDDSPHGMGRRPEGHFPLTNTNRLLEVARKNRRWFLFVNCPEAHAPYDTGRGGGEYEAVESLVRTLEPHFGGPVPPSVVPEEAFEVLKTSQARAASVALQRVDELVRALPKPFLFVCCADHGDALGERGRWGHGFADEAVMTVPLIIREVT